MKRPLATAVVLFSAAALTACSAADAEPDATGSGEVCPDGSLTFGIEPYEAPDKLEPAYNVLADAITRETGCEVEVLVVEDYSAEVLAMRNGKLDLGQFGPLGYVFASEHAGAEPVASFGLEDGTLSSYTAGIWVPVDSEIQTVGDLEGRDFALGSVGSTSGDALPRFALRTAGVAEDALDMNYSGGHPEALLALKNGTVDAAQINSQTLAAAVAEGTFDPEQYRQIWESDPIPNDPITVPGDAPEATNRAIEEALLNLEPEDIAAVGAFLDVPEPGPMVAVDRETYQPLFDLADTMGLTEEDS